MENAYCVECNEQILLPETKKELKKSTGIDAFAMTIDLDRKYLGGICDDCANSMCNDGNGTISGGGACMPEFNYLYPITETNEANGT